MSPLTQHPIPPPSHSHTLLAAGLTLLKHRESCTEKDRPRHGKVTLAFNSCGRREIIIIILRLKNQKIQNGNRVFSPNKSKEYYLYSGWDETVLSLAPGWAFGELGCRLLLSLDLLTMHASIFTLTAMSLDRYRAVAHPLHTSSSNSSGLLRVGLAWGLAVALSLPMMITLHLEDGENQEGQLCVPAWDEQSSKAYMSVLFCTSILGPGLAIGALYATLGRLYWVSQTRPAWATGSSAAYPPRAPKPKVLLLILGIVLAFWACFLPFWIWQLLPLYKPDMLPTVPVGTQVTVNRILTGLTYGNSCVNPFFYTLLTGKRRRNRQTMTSANQLCRKSSPLQ
ncbi:urotensin-2 receptor isoform X2 [Labrus bergylta]|uniref:urotensin-2 receptor isoform X2 n=1 Tax=Labrus bergylta TaxID=56723 RepID=UPI0033137FF2